MQTRLDALTGRASLPEAANEELEAPADHAPAPQGWDPYEVWRSRIKEPLENKNPRPIRG
jgi:hypothetical protein